MPAPIRIMHVVDGLGKGGMENGLVNLIERLDPERFEHVVYAIRRLGSNADRIPKDRVRVMNLGKKDTDFSLHAASLIRAIREVKPNIVHSRNWGAVEGILAGWCNRNCALVHSEHGLPADASSKEPRRRIWFRRLTYELADRVLSVSYQLRDLHAKRTGFPSHRISVIHNGVDSRRFFPDVTMRRLIRAELGISANQFCIGSVGNLFPVKDHLTLLRAVAKFAESCSNWRLLMIGEGPERPRLEAFVNAYPWKSRVSFLGSSHRVPELLNAMDIFVLPSISEGICNSLLEAMSAGVPVAACDTGGTPEVIVDGESGLLFPVGDHDCLAGHLDRIFRDRDFREWLGKRAIHRVTTEFSLDTMIRNYDLLYRSLKQGQAA